ncbi:serine/threonine-protein kinase 31-like isoform X2 [Dreissena polymorpha]|uniref:serine/threonine-protein kinase 31-like isoform X2 n=1 Tax=Dreissena polymorpha TaxID=45954 RepID=UPI002264078A|nr:serine/threonine-protein kinase 31-like isoform X2 [Dreissena polymorpha]
MTDSIHAYSLNMAGKQKQQTYDVFVGNLPTESNERNIGKLFTPFGEIAGIIVKESSKVKGPYNKFAFVKFLCLPDAERAVKEMDRKKVEGSEIVVKLSEDRRGKPDDRPKRGYKSPDTESLDGGGATAEQDRERETVLITHVESPITLWLQIVNDENTQTIFSITEQMGQVGPAAVPLKGPPEPGKVYGCKFSEDNTWYRCHIKQCYGTDKYKIQYIDYGNVEEVTSSALVEIPSNLASLRGMASKIMLHNTRAKDLSDKMGIQFLQNLTFNQMAQLVKVHPVSDGSGFYGHIYVNAVSLADTMIQAGYCHLKPSMAKGSVGQEHFGESNSVASAQGPFSKLDRGVKPTMAKGPGGQEPLGDPFNVGRPQNMFSKPDRGTNMVPMNQRQPGFPGPHSVAMSQPATMGMGGQQPLVPPNLGFPAKIGGGSPIDASKEKKLQADLIKKRQENEQLRNEKDTANKQLEYMKTKVKTLQDEFAASAAQLQEETLTKRILTVVSLANVVRRLRNQFPPDSQRCFLEEAIALCSDADRVDNSRCQSLMEVGSALAMYKAAQDEISKCRDPTELAMLVSGRDEARRRLHEKLNVCLGEIDRMPLTDRNKQVQEIQDRLSKTYNAYLQLQVQDVPSLETILPRFQPWKSRKDLEFSDVRTATDYCEEALQTALTQIKDKISVQSTATPDKPDLDIDNLMKTYAHALQREINVTDMVHSKDASLIALVIASVRKELQTEASMIENFRILRQEFYEKMKSIEPWLDNTPSFSELQENRKLLRSLKSKLRHLQADKLDLEESGDEGELVSVKEEETKVLGQLQAAVVKSESFMHEMATLADSNFPELRVQYPELGIENYLAYKGLVKSGRDLDMYQLTPGFRPDMSISTFNGQQVLIQEYHIGDGDHCSKDEFLNQVCKYNCDNGVIQSIFFNKSERQAYIETAWTGGEPAETLIKSQTWTPAELQQICVSLVQRVIALHSSGVIHGEITPQSVIIKDCNSVWLVLPDFSRTLAERMMKRYVTDTGVVFQSPELQFSSAESLGPAADVYNMVLLIFLLHNPSGKDSTAGSKEARSLQVLFDRVLSGKSATRVTTEQLLQLDYFSKPLPERSPSQPSPAPSPPVSMVTTVQPAVIKSTTEHMEIGVFRAEDYMSPHVLPPASSLPVVASSDTDNSWTTDTSASATDSSRDSPLDTTLAVTKSDSQHTVTGDSQESTGHAVEELPGFGFHLHLTGGNTPTAESCDVGLGDGPSANDQWTVTETGTWTNPEPAIDVGLAGDESEQDGTNGVDVPCDNGIHGAADFSEASHDGPVPNEKGAACWGGQDNLKNLLSGSSQFLSKKAHEVASCPLTALMKDLAKQCEYPA